MTNYNNPSISASVTARPLCTLMQGHKEAYFYISTFEWIPIFFCIKMLSTTYYFLWFTGKARIYKKVLVFFSPGMIKLDTAFKVILWEKKLQSFCSITSNQSLQSSTRNWGTETCRSQIRVPPTPGPETGLAVEASVWAFCCINQSMPLPIALCGSKEKESPVGK